MASRAHQSPIDYERLADYLRALSVPTRIQLLHKLQVPQFASDIQLPAYRKAADKNPDRMISRQAVEDHLKKLEAVGFVRWDSAERRGQPTRRFVVNHPKVFVVADELRRLSLIRPSMHVVDDLTRPAVPVGSDTQPAAESLPQGPALVLANGPREGHAYTLEGEGPWTIGRTTQLAVAIDHDPFVSQENAEIFHSEEGWFLRDLPGSKNGTTHNWAPLQEGGTTPLAPGDMIGVGRSLLVARGMPMP